MKTTTTMMRLILCIPAVTVACSATSADSAVMVSPVSGSGTAADCGPGDDCCTGGDCCEPSTSAPPSASTASPAQATGCCGGCPDC